MRFYYRDLWIPQTATPEQVKSAYRKLAREVHPDHVASADPARFLAIGEAYQVLSDPKLRAQYDAELTAFVKRRGWVLCPSCGGVLDANTSLRTVRAQGYHCAFCNLDSEPILDDLVEVSFTVSPRARRVAAELGVDLDSVVGTGKGGRIREQDVRAAAAVVDSGRVDHEHPSPARCSTVAAAAAESVGGVVAGRR